MRCIAIINQKGGVGKTTTTVHVSAALAEQSRRVLLVDLDPQSHASLHFGIQLEPDEPGIYDALVQGGSTAGAFRNVSDSLVLLPASIDLVGAELELSGRQQRELMLASALAAYRGVFGFCIIDCPPSLGLLTVNALAAADEVIIPLQPHFLALQGFGRLLETVTLVRQALNPRVRVSGIAMCMYEKGTRLAQEVLADVTQFVHRAEPADAWYGVRVFQTKIRRNVKLAECPSFGQTVFDYAPGSHGAEDYRALTREILNMDAATPVAPDVAGDRLAERATPPVSRPLADVAPLPGPLPSPHPAPPEPSVAGQATPAPASHNAGLP